MYTYTYKHAYPRHTAFTICLAHAPTYIQACIALRQWLRAYLLSTQTYTRLSACSYMATQQLLWAYHLLAHTHIHTHVHIHASPRSHDNENMPRSCTPMHSHTCIVTMGTHLVYRHTERHVHASLRSSDCEHMRCMNSNIHSATWIHHLAAITVNIWFTNWWKYAHTNIAAQNSHSDWAKLHIFPWYVLTSRQRTMYLQDIQLHSECCVLPKNKH